MSFKIQANFKNKKVIFEWTNKLNSDSEQALNFLNNLIENHIEQVVAIPNQVDFYSKDYSEENYYQAILNIFDKARVINSLAEETKPNTIF